MAQNASNDIDYFLLINNVHKADLGTIRVWNNLKVAFDETQIWVKGFTSNQINSVEVKSIPYKTIFYLKEAKLYLQKSLLPDRNVPVSLLWTSIDRALPIHFPPLNHNYFGLEEKISITLVASDTEEDATGMITSLNVLQQYIETAPAIRLQPIRWTIFNKDKVLLIGSPILPITGDTYWNKEEMFIPVGLNFELSILIYKLNQAVNPKKDSLILWNDDTTYRIINKKELQPLSLSSFRNTIHHPLFYSSF